MAVQSVTPAEPASNRLLTGKAKMLLGSCRSAQIHMWRGRDVVKGHAHSSCAGRRTSMPPHARAHAVGPKLKGARERNTPRAISTCACLVATATELLGELLGGRKKLGLKVPGAVIHAVIHAHQRTHTMSMALLGRARGISRDAVDVAAMQEQRDCINGVSLCMQSADKLVLRTLGLLLLAAVVAELFTVDGTCPVIAMHESLGKAAGGVATDMTISVNSGVAYALPPAALLGSGIGFVLGGAIMLIWGSLLQATVTAIFLPSFSWIS